MKPLSERFKLEWTFFINPRTQKVQYNPKCLKCAHRDCKQSYRVKIVACLSYLAMVEKESKTGPHRRIRK